MADHDEAKDSVRAGDEASVGLSIIGDRLTPSVVTETTGITPSRSWQKGEEYFASRSQQWIKKHTGLWGISTESSTVLEAIGKLLSVVEPRLGEIRACADQTQSLIAVSIWWDPEAGQGGFTLPADLLKRLLAIADR